MEDHHDGHRRPRCGSRPDWTHAGRIAAASRCRRHRRRPTDRRRQHLARGRGQLVESPMGALVVTETVSVDNAIGVMWGAEDLFAVLGGPATRYPDGTYREVARHVRSQSLLAAKAHGRMALDSVYLDIKDLDGLRAEVDDALAEGFDAKVAIHPTQLPVIRAGYAPSTDQ